MNTFLALTTAATALPLYAVPNPLDGVNPNPDAFGSQFNNLAVILLGGLWGLVLLFLAGRMILALVNWVSQSRQGYSGDEITASATAFKTSLLVFGLAVGIPIIIGAIIFVIGQA